MTEAIRTSDAVLAEARLVRRVFQLRQQLDWLDKMARVNPDGMVSLFTAPAPEQDRPWAHMIPLPADLVRPILMQRLTDAVRALKVAGITLRGNLDEAG